MACNKWWKVNSQCGIAHVNDETEETAVNILDDGTNSNGYCSHILSLAHPLGAHLWQQIIEAHARRSFRKKKEEDHLVLGIDEAVIDELLIVAVLTSKNCYRQNKTLISYILEREFIMK